MVQDSIISALIDRLSIEIGSSLKNSVDNSSLEREKQVTKVQNITDLLTTVGEIDHRISQLMLDIENKKIASSSNIDPLFS